MTEIGNVIVTDATGLVDLRRKVLAFASTLGATQSVAAPLAAGVSELGRHLLSGSQDDEMRLKISLREHRDRPQLVFDYLYAEMADAPAAIGELFDEFEPLAGDEYGIRAVREFSGQTFAPAVAAKLRVIAQVQSRDELFRSIQTKNAELSANQKKLEKARASADSANEAKSAFLATMSHEIRTPMNAILNMTELALDSEIPSKTRRYLEVVQTSGNSLLSLINDILDFSKIEADKIDLEAIPFSLHKLLDELTDSFRGKAYDKKLEFVACAGHDVPAEMDGDPLRIRQVLFNLIGNAFKFTETGEIVLKVDVVDHVEASGDRGKPRVTLRFSVKDTGIGISEEGQTRLFKSFSQVDSSTTRKYGGTGLGLAISKKLVSLMGGELEVHSEEGQGTDFHFTASFTYNPEANHEDYASRLGHQQVNVLVVEDTPSSAELVETLLMRFGMNCELVNTAEAALQRLVDDSGKPRPPIPDVILMDWLLPGMDGLEALEQIRATSVVSKVPVVMASAFAETTHENRAMNLGANAFLPKPITASTLFDSIFHQLNPTYSTAFFRREDMDKKEDLITQMAALKGARILLAEDNEANQFVVQELFETAELDLTIANNGQEALERLTESRDYDCVLMDMQMPEMDGLTATREIRRRWPEPHLPVIALTANAMKGDMDRCQEAGMDDYVSKPIDRVQLFAALRKWIDVDAVAARFQAIAEAETVLAKPAEISYASPPASNSPEPGGDDEIPELAGIDVQDAIKRLGLPWKSIRKMLLRFAEAQPATLAELTAAIEAGDRDAARRHAHSIAGAAGNLSAVELRQKAKTLEAVYRDGEGEGAELFNAVEEELQRVINSIATLESGTPTGEPRTGPETDSGTLLVALNELREALDDGDIGVIESAVGKVDQLGLPTEVQADVLKIKSMANQYDFFTAAEVAERVIKQLD